MLLCTLTEEKPKSMQYCKVGREALEFQVARTPLLEKYCSVMPHGDTCNVGTHCYNSEGPHWAAKEENSHGLMLGTQSWDIQAPGQHSCTRFWHHTTFNPRGNPQAASGPDEVQAEVRHRTSRCPQQPGCTSQHQ